MGYHIHHAIVVTCFEQDMLMESLSRAEEIFGSDHVSEMIPGCMNGYFSFFVGPDGSKEGWNDSDDWDLCRAKFKEWLIAENNFCEWVEISFGGDEPDKNTKILDYGSFDETDL